MKKFRKYPSTVQFSGVVKTARDHANWNKQPLPKIKFSGGVKLHGTNAGIGFDGTDIWFQSRENILTYESDNAGFATWGIRQQENLKQIFAVLEANLHKPFDAIYIFGEWFGGSIQKSVGVSQIAEKHLGVFQIVAVKTTVVPCEVVEEDGITENIVEELEFLDPVAFHDLFQSLIHNVVVIDALVPPIVLEIDFGSPHLVQNKLLELTLSVETECPFAKTFGVVGGVGEGLVWTPIDAPHLSKFKTKGEKHSASKVSTVRELTEAEITTKNSAAEFVEFACSENRMKQGIDKLGEMGLALEPKSMGAYLKWLGNDVLTECGDTLAQSGIERKDVMPHVAQKAKTWFFAYLNRDAGLEAA